MNLQNISNDDVVAHFEGTSHDGIYVYKGQKKLGFISDLRVTMGRKLAAKFKQKQYSTKQVEERREAMPAAVEEMRSFLENQMSKYGAEVKINITQPNVHLNGHKCYIICDPLSDKFNRLGIKHLYKTGEDMAFELNGYKTQLDKAPKHILVNNLSRDEIVEVIKKLCLN